MEIRAKISFISILSLFQALFIYKIVKYTYFANITTYTIFLLIL